MGCAQSASCRPPHRLIQDQYRDRKVVGLATGDAGGDVVSLAAYLAGLGQADACRRLARLLGIEHD